MRIYKTKMWWFQLRPISRISKKPREIVRRKKGLPQRGLPRGSLYCKQTACIEKLGGEKGCQRCTCATSFHHHHQVLCLPIWKFFVNPSGPRKPPRRGTCHEASTREKIFKRPPLLFTLHRTTSQRLYDFPRIYLWIARCLCIHIYSRFENWRLFFLYQRIYRERDFEIRWDRTLLVAHQLYIHCGAIFIKEWWVVVI